jgi:hypothetical protein
VLNRANGRTEQTQQTSFELRYNPLQPMRKSLAGISIVILALALGAADAVLVEGGLPKDVLPDAPSIGQSYDSTQDSRPTAQTKSGLSESGQQSMPSPSSASAVVSSATLGGVPKSSGPNVLQTLTTLGFEIQDSSELTILRSVIPEQEATVMTKALLRNGDRAGLIAWTESPQVKIYFLSLKEALHASFSPRVEDLLDELQRIPGKPPRNFLTFLDPALSPERMVFLRIRERLIELRIAEGHDEAMFKLVEALTQ